MMTKKWISLLLALALAFSLPLSVEADELISLDVYATARFSRSYPVYSGPGEFYYRANQGKATYGGGSCRVYGVMDEWIMIGYGMTNGGYRIGYITKDALPGMTNVKGSIDYDLTFTGVTMWALNDCYLTDDPVITMDYSHKIEKGTLVTALATMGTDWTYVEFVAGSQLIRGFVWSHHLTTDPSLPTPTPQPTPAPTPNYPPIYYPTATPNPTYTGTALLKSLTHNCPNTGIMAPSAFSPYQNVYLLTVADWVSRVTFTPVAMDANATIAVNGQYIRSGQTSQVFNMTDKPQAVTIQVTSGSASSTYTVYLQRRPSEKRTRVSAGYINQVYMKGNEWRISADLVTIKYSGEDYNSGNLSAFENDTYYLYDHVVDPHCDFYYGTKANCFRAYNVQEFMNNYLLYGNSLYTIVYIEDKIVAVFPYGADY